MRSLPKFFFALTLVLSACGGGGGSDSGSTEADESLRITASCGVIENTSLETDIATDKLEQVTVRVVEPDTLIVSRVNPDKATNEQLVKILGISSDSVSPKARLSGIELVRNLARPYAYMLLPDQEAETYVDPTGETGIYAQLFASSGESISEALVARGYAAPTLDGLFSDQLIDCYRTLERTEDSSPSFRTTCGVMNAGTLENPISTSQLELVSIELFSPDFMVGTLLEGPAAGQTVGIKLHGVTADGTSDYLIQEGMNRARELVGQEAYLLRSGQGCLYTSPSGGQAELGQVFSLDGTLLSEELIALGVLTPSNNGCQAAKLTSCYSTIEVEAPEPPQPDPPVSEGEDGNPEDIFTDTEIDNFLWKPVSESTGKLVVLVNVYNVQVRVIGKVTEDLVFTGASNGRGTTARASRSGCAFGRNIEVQFFDQAGNRVKLVDGRNSVNIRNGCDRVEFRL